MSGCGVLIFCKGKVSDDKFLVIVTSLIFVETLPFEVLLCEDCFCMSILFFGDIFCKLFLIFCDTFCELFLIFNFRHLPDAFLIKEIWDTQLFGIPGGGCFSASPLPGFPPPTLRRLRRPRAPGCCNHFGCNRSGSNRSGYPGLLGRALGHGLGPVPRHCCP